MKINVRTTARILNFMIGYRLSFERIFMDIFLLFYCMFITFRIMRENRCFPKDPALPYCICSNSTNKTKLSYLRFRKKGANSPTYGGELFVCFFFLFFFRFSFSFRFCYS